MWFGSRLGCQHSKRELVPGCVESTKGVLPLLVIETLVHVYEMWQDFLKHKSIISYSLINL